MPSTAMVRVSGSTQAVLKELSAKTGYSMQELVDQAVESLRRETILRESNEAYARLKANPTSWKKFKKELETWDQTLGDGLERE